MIVVFFAKALTTNCSLTNLDLRDNRIGADGAASLSEVLEVNKTVNVQW